MNIVCMCGWVGGLQFFLNIFQRGQNLVDNKYLSMEILLVTQQAMLTAGLR